MKIHIDSDKFANTFMANTWLFGWLFVIGYGQLSFWQGVMAFIIWPYYLAITLVAKGVLQ